MLRYGHRFEAAVGLFQRQQRLRHPSIGQRLLGKRDELRVIGNGDFAQAAPHLMGIPSRRSGRSLGGGASPRHLLLLVSAPLNVAPIFLGFAAFLASDSREPSPLTLAM